MPRADRAGRPLRARRVRASRRHRRVRRARRAGRLAGDPERVVFARSCMKPVQAAVSLGAIDVGVPEREVAVMCSSHNGEPVHVRAVRGLLRRGGGAGVRVADTGVAADGPRGRRARARAGADLPRLQRQPRRDARGERPRRVAARLVPIALPSPPPPDAAVGSPARRGGAGGGRRRVRHPGARAHAARRRDDVREAVGSEGPDRSRGDRARNGGDACAAVSRRRARARRHRRSWPRRRTCWSRRAPRRWTAPSRSRRASAWRSRSATAGYRAAGPALDLGARPARAPPTGRPPPVAAVAPARGALAAGARWATSSPSSPFPPRARSIEGMRPERGRAEEIWWDATRASARRARPCSRCTPRRWTSRVRATPGG